MTRACRVAVLGATGAVGTEMISLLQERQFPLTSLKLLASERSAGKWVDFGSESLPVEVLTPEAVAGSDIVLGATGAELSREIAPAIVGTGGVFIDNSSAFRQDPGVPLVVPEVNADDIALHRGIIANPNCSVILLAVVLWPLHRLRRVRRVVLATYQAASGAGAAAMAELETQTRAVLAGEVPQPGVFAHPIAFNLFPHDSAIGPSHYCEEELKVIHETRRIFHFPELRITATCVRVPIPRAHSEAVNVEFDEPLSVAEAVEALQKAPGLQFVEDWERNHFPMPCEASGRDPVLVGRVRQDLSCQAALELWLSGDQLRKGAALNAVQIAEHLVGSRL